MSSAECPTVRTQQRSMMWLKRVSLMLTVLLYGVCPAHAQPSGESPLPRSGVLSRTHSSGTSHSGLELPWGTEALSPDQAPISGSVSRISGREWVARVFNNSEDTYSVSVKVRQFGAGNKEVKYDTYSYTLKPRESKEQKFLSKVDTIDAGLDLTSWTNLSEKKRKVEAVAPAAPAPTLVISTPIPTQTPRLR